jgi:hypothetical protein
MYQFFLGLQNYLPAFTPEFTAQYAADAVDLAELEQRLGRLEVARRLAIA